MKTGFTPIQLQDYVKLHLRANPDARRAELIGQLKSAIDAYRSGARCRCGSPIWIIGSSQAGLGCCQRAHPSRITAHGAAGGLVS